MNKIGPFALHKMVVGHDKKSYSIKSLGNLKKS